jgi:hypothetical protein
MSASKPLWSLLDMLKPYGSLVISTLEVLREISEISRPDAKGGPDTDKAIRQFIKIRMPILPFINEQIPIRSTVDQAERVKALLAKDTPGEELLQAFKELGNRFTDDLEHVQFHFVRADLVPLYGDPNLLGESVAKRFPSVVPEIEDAGSAHALERWTASAFHTIRCLEAGIRALTRCLGIPDPTKGSDRNWSSILRSVKAEMDRRWPSATDKMAPDYITFDGIFGALSALQNPYRNETMHLDARYDEGEARHIMEMVRGLMQRVAARCDENGDPKV